jgi:hypothetical protein
MQNNDYNCGPWVVTIFEHLLHGALPENLDVDQKRTEYQEILTNYSLSGSDAGLSRQLFEERARLGRSSADIRRNLSESFDASPEIAFSPLMDEKNHEPFEHSSSASFGSRKGSSIFQEPMAPALRSNNPLERSDPATIEYRGSDCSL